MPIFNLSSSKQGIGLSDDETIINFLNSDSKEYVSASEALKNSDIFSLIAQLSGDLALVSYKASRSRLQSLIDDPSTTSNGFSFWQAMFAQLLLDGNAYAYRWRNINGVDLRWEYLRPSQVEAQLLNDGSGLVYNLNFDEPDIPYKQGVSQADMIHLRLMSKNGGMTGVSPLEALTSELNIKQSSNKLTLNALNKSVEAPGILSITGGGLLDWKKKSARSRQFMKQVSNSRGGPVVLDDLETYQPLEVKGDVAKLLSQADWTGKQIAKVYGIPDSYLNGQGDQQSNVTQISGQYAKALHRYVKPIVSELNSKLNCSVTYDMRSVVDAMGDEYATAVNNLTSSGVLAKNQARYVLQRMDFLPDDLPDPEISSPIIPMEGGEENGNNSN
ncbi:phage portal protein [Lactobacillus sp. LL6]|uniref:phage portal protein n=1 Tax=Lactobacillus sp. LL6 TaxID=2596827 RepID=UPI0011859387|nr:phage portal protein [Lactobacillus sp. LL6]TSO25298.1 phage portal protein [Lactobacillus sp. LL6]